MLSEDEKTGSLIVFLQCFLRGFCFWLKVFQKQPRGPSGPEFFGAGFLSLYRLCTALEKAAPKGCSEHSAL